MASVERTLTGHKVIWHDTSSRPGTSHHHHVSNAQSDKQLRELEQKCSKVCSDVCSPFWPSVQPERCCAITTAVTIIMSATALIGCTSSCGEIQLIGSSVGLVGSMLFFASSCLIGHSRGPHRVGYTRV